MTITLSSFLMYELLSASVLSNPFHCAHWSVYFAAEFPYDVLFAASCD